MNLYNLEDSYRNPFAQYNANKMLPEDVLQFWCDPFEYLRLPIESTDFLSDENPLILFGGRGTGKTMILKFWSYEVQMLRSDLVLKEPPEQVGIYLRFPGSSLRALTGAESTLPDQNWSAIFNHYFELSTAVAYLDYLSSWSNVTARGWKASNELLRGLSILIHSDADVFRDLVQAREHLHSQLSYVSQYLSDIAFTKLAYSPDRVFQLRSLSMGIPSLIRSQVDELRGTRFVLMLDEYENYSQEQQRSINTLVKFADQQVTFRLAMRLSGFRTFATVTPDDFIKETRDYTSIIIEEVLLRNKGYSEYLRQIAKKRLEQIPALSKNHKCDIVDYLGLREDLEVEASSLVESRYEEVRDRIMDHYSIPENKRQVIGSDEPLLQVLNALWYVRGRKPSEIQQAHHDYRNGVKSEAVEKYQRDYVDKYKLSLTFILTSILKKEKMYYSFNTFAYLSSGIVGQFVELCRRTFQIAEFESRDRIMEGSQLSMSIQNKAAHEFAEAELRQIRRIDAHGAKLYTFMLNLGAILRSYHLDKLIRYPETNQFTVDEGGLSSEPGEAFRVAQMWSIIQRKKGQQTSIGKGKGDIYTINRALAPFFSLSYRTRGGYAEELTGGDIEAMMSESDYYESLGINRLKAFIDPNQLELDF